MSQAASLLSIHDQSAYGQGTNAFARHTRSVRPELIFFDTGAASFSSLFSLLQLSLRLQGRARRAGPDGLDVEHEKQARPAGGEMSGQSGPP